MVGQQHVLDPSRVPPGRAALWVQLQEVPFAPSSDAAGELDVSAGWDDERLVGGYVERVLGRIEAHAPGLRALVTRWSAVSPAGVAAANRNAVRGDPYGGSAELDHNLIWRPGLGSGHLVARQLLAVPHSSVACSPQGERSCGDPSPGHGSTGRRQGPGAARRATPGTGRADATVRCR
ncbi:hypothetical protein [Streptomyces sp. NBC_01236]|uniref:hypothetical protein n=1 Tax=Streptomyces sp. NBC_01236 TaxID=2903789 RepID=UPI002E0E85DC|nr:hypothetical protein OG324_01415 [Streptomyces sp. NBC_01236]